MRGNFQSIGRVVIRLYAFVIAATIYFAVIQDKSRDFISVKSPLNYQTSSAIDRLMDTFSPLKNAVCDQGKAESAPSGRHIAKASSIDQRGVAPGRLATTEPAAFANSAALATDQPWSRP